MPKICNSICWFSAIVTPRLDIPLDMKSALKQGWNLTLQANFNVVRGTACATAQDPTSWSASMTFLWRIWSNSRGGRDHKGRKRQGQTSISSVMLTHSGADMQTCREWWLHPQGFGGRCVTLVLVLQLWGCYRVHWSQKADEIPTCKYSLCHWLKHHPSFQAHPPRSIFTSAKKRSFPLL